MRTAWISCVAVVWFCVCACARPDTHYVSLDGSDQAPYLTPETAARSIQRAVDVASPGDKVCVGPGEYRGEVVMGPGVAIIGSGAQVTEVWGGIRAGPDCQIEGIGLRQGCGQEDPGYSRIAIEGPPTGGLTLSRCKVSGTYEKGIESMADTGFLLLLETEISGIRTGVFPEAVSAWGGFYGVRPVVWLIDRCTIRGNAVGVFAGSHALDGAWVMRSRFVGNVAALCAPGARVVQCVVDSNTIGISFGYGFTPTRIESCLVANNTKAGISCADSARAELLNCTITGNGSGMELVDYVQQVQAKSCIIWGNGLDVNAYYAPLSPGEFSAWCSDIGASPDYEYLHDQSIDYRNIDADPLFVKPDAGDYRLKPQSPCIDTGSGENYQATELRTAYDLDGKPRIAFGGRGGGVDMGAYEYYINRVEPGPLPGEVTLTWSSREDSTYTIFYSDDLMAWHLAADNVRSVGYETTSWIDEGSPFHLPPWTAPRRFYRILENP